jgi:DNA-binding GntR family transcriptional regulator
MTERRCTVDASPASTLPPTLSHASLAISATDWITDRILEGHIRPGERITEVSLAEQMGISRSPVREALQALSRGGLIIVEPRRGAFVAELDRSNAADLYTCRLLIEPHCTRLAVESLDNARIAELRAIFTRMQDSAARHDAADYLVALKDFNRGLLDACPNRLLFGFAESSWQASLRYWDLLVRASPDYPTRSLRRNRGMMDAIAARDAGKAEAVAIKVLEFGRAQLLKLLSRLPAEQVPNRTQ